jgi:uncharacterized protein YndB with AHSA1/START domain
MTPAVTLRFERRLQQPVERVWEAITEPEEIEAWWGRADVDLRPGGAMRIEWLNGDVTMPATIIELDPPHLLEIEGEPHGVLRFELEPDGDGTLLRFIAHSPIPDEFRSKVLAGWHFHLDALEDFVADGTRIDWPNWPLDRWQAIHDEYYTGALESDRHSSRQAAERYGRQGSASSVSSAADGRSGSS